MIALDQARHFARLALDCIQREFPNVIKHVINTPADVQSPRALHPAFYGCLDWHSAVHGHWMLVRLLRTMPALPEAAEIRAGLDANLTAANLATETAYFAAPNRASFERPYGWAWLLQLAAELHGWDDADARRWSAHLAPLTETIVARYETFLAKRSYAVRTGVHANTAFGLTLALDFARVTDRDAFGQLLMDRALMYFGADRDAPADWEPGGEDFLSPSLIEADLMRRVLFPEDFPLWLRDFFPHGLPRGLQIPAFVVDRGDAKLAHLDGLNLSRAWCLRSLARAVSPRDPLHAQLVTAAAAHATAGLANVATGDYMGEHWLASFAIYLAGV